MPPVWIMWLLMNNAVVSWGYGGVRCRASCGERFGSIRLVGALRERDRERAFRGVLVKIRLRFWPC